MTYISTWDHAHGYVLQFEHEPALAHSYANWFVELWEATPEDEHIDLDHRREYVRFLASIDA